MLSLLLALSFSAAAYAQQWAVVDISSSFLRLKPDYESSNETQCLMGTVLKVKGADRYWRLVDAPDYKNVWTTELGLAFMTEEQKDAYIAAPKWICTAEYSHIWTSPCKTSQPICDFTMGDLVRQTESAAPGWVKVLTASGKQGWVPRADVEDFGTFANTRNATPESLVATAKRFVGTPYMWGGSSVKHFDCSGFTKFVYLMNGIVLLRNAREQINTGVEVPYDFSLMQPGDLLFYGRKATAKKPALITHVAMYIGDAHIIHSSQLVRINSLRPGDPDYYEKELVGVRRMLGSVDTDPGITSVSKYPWYFVQ